MQFLFVSESIPLVLAIIELNSNLKSLPLMISRLNPPTFDYQSAIINISIHPNLRECIWG